MEVCPNENANSAVASEDLSWALQIGDLDTVKEQLQTLARKNGVPNYFRFKIFNCF